MIYFFSGTPGSGKSLHTAKMIDSWVKRGKNIVANFDINEKFWKKRKGVISCVDNRNLTVDYLLDFAQQNHKFNSRGQMLEKQTLLVIDECQTMFNSRSWNSRGRDRWVIFFTQHRKFGYEVILISQNKDLVDKQIRGCFEYDYIHRNIRNFKAVGYLIAMLFGGNFILVKIVWMTNRKKDHTEFLFGMRRFYSLYDSYKIFDTQSLRQIPAPCLRDGDEGVPNERTGGRGLPPT